MLSSGLVGCFFETSRFSQNGRKDENIINDKVEIAHKFNNCFTNIGPNLANTININTDKTHQFYMNSKTLINFEFTDVDENTVIDVLRQLPLKSSFGFDGISSHLLYYIT